MKKASIILGLFALVMCLADRVAACDYGQAQQIIAPQAQYQQVQRVIVPQVQRVQVQRVIVQQQRYAAQQVQRVIVQHPRGLSLNLRVR